MTDSILRGMLIGVAVFAGGCAVTSRPIMGPNGGEAYAMNCMGPVEKCYSKAGELCPGGYEVIDRASTGYSSTNTHTGQTTLGTRNSLMIECKK